MAQLNYFTGAGRGVDPHMLTAGTMQAALNPLMQAQAVRYQQIQDQMRREQALMDESRQNATTDRRIQEQRAFLDRRATEGRQQQLEDYFRARGHSQEDYNRTRGHAQEDYDRNRGDKLTDDETRRKQAEEDRYNKLWDAITAEEMRNDMALRQAQAAGDLALAQQIKAESYKQAQHLGLDPEVYVQLPHDQRMHVRFQAAKEQGAAIQGAIQTQAQSFMEALSSVPPVDTAAAMANLKSDPQAIQLLGRNIGTLDNPNGLQEAMMRLGSKKGVELATIYQSHLQAQAEKSGQANTMRAAVVLQQMDSAYKVAEAQIRTLAGMLQVFGLYMPLDFADAMGAMYVASKAATEKTPDALLALITYQGLREHYTDRDIYLGARHLELTQEPEE
jgi:hypothetical protein